MMKKIYPLLIALVLLVQPFSVYSRLPQSEAYEMKKIASIYVKIENLSPGATFNQDVVLSRLRTKAGDPFSQTTFDQDLKTLSEDYDRVEPTLRMQGKDISITLRLWQKTHIRTIKWEGNKSIKAKKLAKELGIKPYEIFNRESFTKALNKVKEFYVKKGFFEVQAHYLLIPQTGTNEVDILIKIDEGKSGHISDVVLTGFTKKEESHVLELIHTKRYNFFTSWLTGQGTYQQEALDHDNLIIVDYLQNQGYADAKVTIEVQNSTHPGKIKLSIHADRGELFHVGDVTFHGNTLFTDEEIRKVLIVQPDAIYSPEKLRTSMQNVKDLYGKKGYIEADIQYSVQLLETEPAYNVNFQIVENEEYKVGLIRVLGNTQTSSSVILHESLLIPGEIFDSRKLKATQERLEAIGYFKSVNVYAVRSADDKSLGPTYRDVVIEVEETTTGNLSLFFGFSTADDLFGGLDIVENNFNYKGLGRLWKDGLPAVRGGGEYAHARVSIGQKQTTYMISWLTPYFRDTLWRVGFDVNYSLSSLQSDDYRIDTLGFSTYANYPVTPFWTQGWRFRVRNAVIKISKSAGFMAEEQAQNSGLVSGITGSLNYDSTNSSYKPTRGLRSALEAEIAGVRRHASHQKDFPFLRFGYTNTHYYSVWRKGVLKSRGDLKYIATLGDGEPTLLPISERFFLGGENSVRGYVPFSIGPKYVKLQPDGELKVTNDPQGGVSSLLLSVEYLQNIFRPIDAFVFFDGGAISMKQFDIRKFQMSYGVGLRLEVGPRLPLTIGMGFPINPESKAQVRRFFFSMGGQF